MASIHLTTTPSEKPLILIIIEFHQPFNFCLLIDVQFILSWSFKKLPASFNSGFIVLFISPSWQFDSIFIHQWGSLQCDRSPLPFHLLNSVYHFDCYRHLFVKHQDSFCPQTHRFVRSSHSSLKLSSISFTILRFSSIHHLYFFHYSINAIFISRRRRWWWGTIISYKTSKRRWWSFRQRIVYIIL